MRQLLLATRNAHKTREFAETLGTEFEVRDLASAPEFAAAEETGLTADLLKRFNAAGSNRQSSTPVSG